MASAVQKIKLGPSRDIPFNKLVLSQANVRRVKGGVSIEQLAESIALRTLLQSLNVRAILDADGKETGMFEVPAGGRRYRALELLVKQKRMAKTQAVPCVVRDEGIAEDNSLPENDERVGLHPLDQFRTFRLLREGGDHFVEAAHVRADRRRRRQRPSQGSGAISGRARRRAGGMTMPGYAPELAHRLAREAEAVCRRYLSNGRREGRYWLVGDVKNTPGRSMFVRLKGPESGKGAAGKWTDAATGEHGDLLDIIRETCGLADFHDVADEARRFLSLPRSEPDPGPRHQPAPAAAGSPESARRLFAMSQPIAGTSVEAYLRKRGITALYGTGSLRFHPRCYYRSDRHSPTETWPAMIAAVTDLDGRITGAHRTYLDPLWLDPSGSGKAPIDTPRRAMGHLLGNAVRFGTTRDVMAAGEGIETMLSLRCVMPTMPMVAALSAAHLAAVLFPPTLRRLYVVRDNDPAGDGAMAGLFEHARTAWIDAIALSPHGDDFNDDLRQFGIDALRAALRVQLAPEDVARFMQL